MAGPASGTAAAAEAGDAGRSIAEAAGQEVDQTLRAAASEVDRTAARAREAVDRAIGQPLPAPARLATSTTLSEAAEALADDLMRIPGIQRFGGMRLQELESSGPRPLRTMWRVARDRLERDYGQLTIGEIIDRYRGGGGVSTGT